MTKKPPKSLSVFALIGYQLFHGSLRHKCVLEPTTTISNQFNVHLVEWNTNEQPYTFQGAKLDHFWDTATSKRQRFIAYFNRNVQINTVNR